MTDPSKPRPAELDRLSAFDGEWVSTGQAFGGPQQDPADPEAHAVPWKSTERYEWLEGRFFQTHYWEADVGGHRFVGTEIVGYDAGKREFFTRFFDNSGNHPEYRVTVDGRVWRFEENDTRAVITFAADGEGFDFDWEWKNGGTKWLPLCRGTATRKR